MAGTGWRLGARLGLVVATIAMIVSVLGAAPAAADNYVFVQNGYDYSVWNPSPTWTVGFATCFGDCFPYGSYNWDLDTNVDYTLYYDYSTGSYFAVWDADHMDLVVANGEYAPGIDAATWDQHYNQSGNMTRVYTNNTGCAFLNPGNPYWVWCSSSVGEDPNWYYSYQLNGDGYIWSTLPYETTYYQNLEGYRFA